MTLHIKRIYDEPKKRDGYRVLVDRLWPRGIKRADAQIDEWLRVLAPSTGLRTWYHAGDRQERMDEFSGRYKKELKNLKVQSELSRIRSLAQKRTVTLLTATRDLEQSYLSVLKKTLL